MSETEESVILESEQTEEYIDNSEASKESIELAENIKKTHSGNSLQENKHIPEENNDNTRDIPPFSTHMKQKSVYTMISEELMKNLHNSGQFQFDLCYENLVNENLITNTIISKNQKPFKNKIISHFLERNGNSNLKNVPPNSVSQEKGLIKVKLSPREQESKSKKAEIRSPEKYQEDQILFVEGKKRRIQEQRKKQQKKTQELCRSKPEINKRSKSIASKMVRNKNAHERLFEKIPKKKPTYETVKHSKKNSINFTKKEIDECVNKLYQEGVEKVKKRGDSNIPCHMEKVNLFYSRDFNSYNSNIRTNNKKDSYAFETMRKQASCENINKSNRIIIINGIMKEIENTLNKEDKEKTISYIKLYDLFFHLGFLQYNHEKIFASITNENGNSNGNVKEINYKNKTIEINEFIIKLSKENEAQFLYPYSNKISFDNLLYEYILIEKAYKCIQTECKITESTSSKNEPISITQTKLFLLIILGLYTGNNPTDQQDKSNNPLPQCNNPLLTKSKCLSKTKSDKSMLSKYSSSKVSIESINTIILKQLSLKNGPLPLNCKKIKNSFKYFSQCRALFESYKRQIKREEKMNNYPLNQEMTFKPKIESTKGESLKLENNYSVLKQRHMGEIEKMQKEKIVNEMKECTFIPNNRKVDPAKSIEISERLYNVCKNKKNENISAPQNNNNDKECTFCPSINQKLNEEIFKVNPIKNDSLLNLKIEKCEKARLEKQLLNFIYYQSGNPVTKIKNSEDFLKEFQKEQKLENFKFGIEHKTNKDTFDKFSKEKKTDGKKNKKRTPLFTIEVKIKDKIELLDYYKNDDPAKITKMFCKRHNLGESSNDKILSVIEDKLKNSELSESNNS